LGRYVLPDLLDFWSQSSGRVSKWTLRIRLMFSNLGAFRMGDKRPTSVDDPVGVRGLDITYSNFHFVDTCKTDTSQSATAKDLENRTGAGV